MAVNMGAISNTALTPLSFLEPSAHVWPGKVAVIYGRRRLTYAEFAAGLDPMSRMKGTLVRSAGAISPVTVRLRNCNVPSDVALSN